MTSPTTHIDLEHHTYLVQCLASWMLGDLPRRTEANLIARYGPNWAMMVCRNEGIVTPVQNFRKRVHGFSRGEALLRALQHPPASLSTS